MRSGERHRGDRLLRRLLRDLPRVPENLPGLQAGYLGGSRNLNRARCKMKKCCLARGCITCGDCAAYESCGTVQSFLSHPGYKYGKYRQALEYIRAHGHAAFLKMARHWTGACGRFPEEAP